MCATIAAMAVQITRTQIATAIVAEISDIVSSLPFMNSSLVGLVAVSMQYKPTAWTGNLRVCLRRTTRAV
jgi:hypothetical protein